MQDHNKLVVWKEAHQLTLDVHELLKQFPKSEKIALVSQMWRAAVSMTANIVEGSGKFTQKDFAHYLQISIGSTKELEYYFLLSKDLNYIPEVQYLDLSSRANKVRAMLINLTSLVRKKNV